MLLIKPNHNGRGKITVLFLFSLLFFVWWIYKPTESYSSGAVTGTQFVQPHSGVKMPKLIYGTAWKKDRTKDLVYQALLSGFRGVDTACQPRHYNEKLVGEAISKAIKEGRLKREDLFIQTKFTSPGGQDVETIPYDSSLPTGEQVFKSFEKSQQNLGTKIIDSYVLHSPYNTLKETLEAWTSMEKLYDTGSVKQLGISNIYNQEMLLKFWESVRIKPAVIQNRFDINHNNFDQETRRFCKNNNIVYQSFWTLTATKQQRLLHSPQLSKIAQSCDATNEQILLKAVMNLGIVPLVGTTKQKHMEDDLKLINSNFEIQDKDQQLIMEMLGIKE